MFRIGEFSKLTKTPIKTLRYYDEVGILIPHHVDEFTGYRFYSTVQLTKLHEIKSYRQMGLGISDIRLILIGENVNEILERQKFEIEKDILQRTEQLSQIEFILSGKKELYFMNYQAVIKDLPACIVYSKKITVPSYDAYFTIIPEIGKKVTQKYPDLKCSIPEYCFIVYLDGEYREKDFNIEFCEAIEKMKPDFDDIVFKEIQSVKGVSVMHKGDYASLPQAYAYAFKWIEDNGYMASDNPRESYIDGIWNKENKEDWLTELQIPIIKKNS